MGLSDIKIQLQELYGAEISESLISKITDNVIDKVRIWQSQPLESVYAIVFFDCLVLKVRQDKRIINKAVYVGIRYRFIWKERYFWVWISENECSKFWLGNLTELKNRGMRDMLIAL